MKNENNIAIKVHGLAKCFGDVQAVTAVDFEVKSAELFGFLGPNGAGKTTTINMLTGLARPDTGTICLGDIDCTSNPRAAQHLIGVVPDECNLYPELSGFDNLCFCAALYGMGKAQRQLRAKELLEAFDLTKAAGRKFGGYSKGMKRRLTIAAGIIHNPQILFLDEPTTGIDVASARQLRQLIKDLHDRGTTIFLTTHYIEEAERLCDRVAFILNGRIVQTDSVTNLIEPFKGKHILQISCTNASNDLLDRLAVEFSEQGFTSPQPGVIRVEDNRPISVGPLVRFLEDLGSEVSEARKIRPTLEDVFIRITGIGADVMKQEKEQPGAKP